MQRLVDVVPQYRLTGWCCHPCVPTPQRLSHPCVPTLLSVEAPLRVPEGCLSLRAACFLLYARLKPRSPRSRYTASLLSLPRAQRGSVSQRLAKGCCLAPSPRPDQRVSRPAAGGRPVGRTASRPARGGPGVRWRGGRRARFGRAPQREGSWGTDAVSGKGRLNFLYSATRAAGKHAWLDPSSNHRRVGP
jgi:hypothetical protein